MLRFAKRMVQAAFILGALILVGPALLAVLGFVSPLFDAVNHLQPLLFAGTLAALLLTPLIFARSRLQSLVMALTATGFLASAAIVVPEFIAGFLNRPAPPPGAKIYRLMTYNLFGLNGQVPATLARIREEKPDILTLQEYVPRLHRAMGRTLEADYPYSLVCDHGTKRGNVALYARLPFDISKTDPCHDDKDYGTSTIIARFTPANSPAFTVATTHLDWPIQISPLQSAPDLFSGLKATYRRKQAEYKRLSSDLAAVKGPLIVTGDFNATSWSYGLRGFAQVNGLTRQNHSLFTYPQLWYLRGDWRRVPAFLPLDHIMTRKGIAVSTIKAAPPAGSDHKPLVARFTIAENDGASE